MNAAAKITPTRDKYAPIVRQHCPDAGDVETDLRCSILMMRDKASASARTCCDEAHGLLLEAARIATMHAFNPMSYRSLAALRLELQMLIRCASGLEAFHHSIGESHEGG